MQSRHDSYGRDDHARGDGDAQRKLHVGELVWCVQWIVVDVRRLGWWRVYRHRRVCGQHDASSECDGNLHPAIAFAHGRGHWHRYGNGHLDARWYHLRCGLHGDLQRWHGGHAFCSVSCRIDLYRVVRWRMQWHE